MKFIQDDDGVTSIEYALIASVIVTTIVGALNLIGTNLTAIYQAVADGFGG